MYRDYVKEISVLSKQHVHIKDKIRINQLLNKIIDGGRTKLQVVFDFDRTLTKQHENGKVYQSSFGKFGKFLYEPCIMQCLPGIFRHCRSITQQFLEIEESLRSKYYPIEIDPKIPFEEKREAMEEWWALSEVAFK